MQFRLLRQVAYDVRMGKIGWNCRFAGTYGPISNAMVVAVNIYRMDPGDGFRALNFAANQLEQALAVRFATFAKARERMEELCEQLNKDATNGDSYLTYPLPDLPEEWESENKQADSPF